MNKILLFIIGIFIISSCSNQKKKSVVYASDNPAERVVWEHIRLADPNTGQVPRKMRQKEIAFAKTIPKSNILNKANWIHRGPYNVGGRTRALC